MYYKASSVLDVKAYLVSSIMPDKIQVWPLPKSMGIQNTTTEIDMNGKMHKCSKRDLSSLDKWV